MKLMITAMSGKSEEETTEDMLNDGCDVIENILYYVDENYKNFQWVDIETKGNFTQITLDDGLTT